MRSWIAVVVVSLIAGCAGSATPEEADAAHDLAREGKVDELRAMLAENPAIANTPVMGDDRLLNVVVDTRPAFPKMYFSVVVLLEAGADPNWDAPKILRKSIWRSDPEVFALLLEHGADPTAVWAKKNINMLEYARGKGDERFDAICDAWEASH